MLHKGFHSSSVFSCQVKVLDTVSGTHCVTQDIKQHILHNSREVSLVHLCSLLNYHLQNILKRREYSISVIGMGVWLRSHYNDGSCAVTKYVVIGTVVTVGSVTPELFIIDFPYSCDKV